MLPPFSTLLCRVRKINPEPGETEGSCSICGKHTLNGHRKVKKLFSGNFTSANMISHGDVLCPECYYLLKNSNEYRRTMFLLTEHEYIPFKKQEAYEIIFNQLPENEGFYIYLTKTWQQIGWVMMNQAPNTNKNNIVQFLMDYDIIRCNLNELKKICSFYEELRSLKIPKTVLEKGNLEPQHYQKIKEEYGSMKARRINKTLIREKNNPVYDLALYIIK